MKLYMENQDPTPENPTEGGSGAETAGTPEA